MDLLVEKLDGIRYYLSQYKVLITDFEESAPSVTRNSTQLDQRNGNIDFGGWHTDKTINITGYYRANDMDEEEMLREKLYALLSDPDGYYITQLKTTPNVAMERPGQTSGGYYDKLSDYPSHKRFLVYTEAPEMELVGNVNGTLLYKLTAEFKTLKLPYGETPLNDVSLDSPYKDVPVNLLTGTSTPMQFTGDGIINNVFQTYKFGGKQLKDIIGAGTNLVLSLEWSVSDKGALGNFQVLLNNAPWSFGIVTNISSGSGHYYASFPINSDIKDSNANGIQIRMDNVTTTITISNMKLEIGTTASPWSPNPADPEYNSWYYSLSGNVSVPYSGSVPCNQLEQGFSIELTAKGTASSLSFKIDDTELTSSNAVAAGDVFMFSGFSYTQNGLSIVSKTNKAYFVLQPDKPNRITCNVPGTVRILGFQNLYA